MSRFKLVIDKAKKWKDFLSVFKAINDEVTLDITPEGIKARMMDVSHVALIELKLSKDWFTELVYEGEKEKVQVCFNVIEMAKMLKRTKKLDLEISEGKDGTLDMVLSKENFKKIFTISVLEPLDEVVPVPKIVFDAEVKIVVETLKSIVADLAGRKYISMIIADEHIKFFSTDYSGSVEIGIEKESEHILGITVNGEKECKSMFSVEYITEIIKGASALSDVVTLKNSTDMPIKLEFELNDGELSYYLAPRIEQE